MEIGFHGTVDEDVGGEGRKKEKKNKEDGVYGEREEGEVELGRGRKRRGLMVWTRLEERGRVG